MEHKQNEGFSYTYSAREQAEIRRIREKYTESKPKEDQMERLRRLDGRVTKKAQTVALILGIAGALILGFGMSLIMTELGQILGVYRTLAVPLGIGIGVIGGGLAGLAYPIYQLVIKRERQKIAPEILKLTDELMK